MNEISSDNQVLIIFIASYYTNTKPETLIQRISESQKCAITIIVITRCCHMIHRFLDLQYTKYVIKAWNYIAGLRHLCPLPLILMVCFAFTIRLSPF